MKIVDQAKNWLYGHMEEIGTYSGILSICVAGAGIITQPLTGIAPEAYLFPALGLGMTSTSALDSAAQIPSGSELEKKLTE